MSRHTQVTFDGLKALGSHRRQSDEDEDWCIDFEVDELRSLSAEDKEFLVDLEVDENSEVRYDPDRWSHISNEVADGICNLCCGTGQPIVRFINSDENTVTITYPTCPHCRAAEETRKLLPAKYQWINYRSLKPTELTPVPATVQQQMIEGLRNGDLGGHSVLWSGPSRTGKTVLASALMHSMVKQYITNGFFRRYGDRRLPIYRVNADRWLAAHVAYETQSWDSGNDRLPRAEPNIDSVLKLQPNEDSIYFGPVPCPPEFPPVLVIEELDKFRPTEFKLNALFTLMNAVAEAGGMIISTSNLPTEEFRAKYPDWFYRRLTESNVDNEIRHFDFFRVLGKAKRKSSQKSQPSKLQVEFERKG